MASATVVDENGLHAPVIRSIFRQTGDPLGSGKLSVEISEARERQIHLLLRSIGEARFRSGSLKTNRLRPNLVFAAVHRWEQITPRFVGVYRGCKCLAHSARGNADTLERFAVRRFDNPG